MANPWIKERTTPEFLEGRTTWYGVFARSVGALNERAWVILPEWHKDLQVGPCYWQTRDDVSLPQRGMRCLIQFDNRRQPWVIAWWPFDT